MLSRPLQIMAPFAFFLTMIVKLKHVLYPPKINVRINLVVLKISLVKSIHRSLCEKDDQYEDRQVTHSSRGNALPVCRCRGQRNAVKEEHY